MSNTHFGPITVQVDHTAKRATLTIRRRLQPLSERVIERLHTWALSVTKTSYPEYESNDTVLHDIDKEKN